MSKKKKSSGSKSSFNPKEFLILHVEKLVFGLIAGIACVVIYLGFNTKPFPSEKTPEKLQEQATQVSRSLKENHNEVIMKEEGRKVDPIYAKSALNTRIIKDPVAHASNPMGAAKTNTSSKRGDPAVLAPEHLEASYFYGAVARLSTSPDPLDKLEDAKKPEEKVKPDNSQERSFKGKGGSSSMGSSGSGSGGGSGAASFEGEGGMAGSSMGMMGSGGGGGGDPLLTGQRRLSPMYDLGYKFGMRTFPETNAATSMIETNSTKPDAAVKKPVAMALGLVCVTALAPHEEMEDSFKKQFYEVVGYTPGRDTPNYVGFEAQRAEVSLSNPDKEIAESDWVALPKSSPATFKDTLKVLQGTANEVHLPDWVDPNISMPIPPILMTDYRKYASNSVLAELESEQGALGAGSANGYAGGSSMGMSSGSGSFMNEGESGSVGSMGMPGSSSMGMPGGSSMGMAGGMAKGGKSSGGSSASSGGSGGNFDGGGAANFVMEMPKQLPSTKYKLVRFYDVNPPTGKVFKYRVRLLMYDSNHPEWVVFKPAASTLNNEALKRVQALESEEGKEVPKGGTALSGPAKRVSQRESNWSEPSKPILIVKPASVFMSKSEDKVETVFVDFEKDRAIEVPRKEVIKENVDAGLVFGTPPRAKNKEAPIDIVHPIKKIIKALKDFRSTNLVTIVNIKSSTDLLKMGNAGRDPIKAGAEMVSFDPLTGQLVVSREFDNFTNFYFHTQPDLPPVGPLGGGLTMGGTAAFGSDGGMSSGGEGSPGGPSGSSGMSGSGGPKKGMSSAAGK